MTHEALVIRSLTTLFFSFFLVLSVDESVLSHCQLSLFCYGDKSAVTLDWASRGEKELDQDQQNSLEFFISFRCLFSCLIAICHSFIGDLNCHNSLNAWQYPTLGCGSSSLATKLKAGLALRWWKCMINSCVWCIPMVNVWPVPFCKTWIRKIKIAVVHVVLTKKIIIIIIYSIYRALIPNGPKALYIIKITTKS